METQYTSGNRQALRLNLFLGFALLTSAAQASIDTSELLPPGTAQVLQQATSQVATSTEQKETKALSQSEIIDQATSQSAAAHVITNNKDGSVRIPSPMQDVIATLTPNGARIYSDDKAGETFALLVKGIGREEGKLAQIKPGKITHDEKIARLIRNNLVEEFTTSSAGLRQDFVVPTSPKGKGKLTLALEIEGASAKLDDRGVMLTLKSGRELAYHNLLVADARGTTLPAHFALKEKTLQIIVDDAGATYPVRIDPTITDADWFSLGAAMPKLSGHVNALVLDSTGNLYVGGNLGIIGVSNTTNIAKWDGSNWSALGTGVNNTVSALAMAGPQLYAGGLFTKAGSVYANHIARWDGSKWNAVGGGVVGGGTNSWVRTLVSDGNSLYAGGDFTSAGGVNASFIARWSGTSWSPVGGGMSAPVYSLLFVGTDLYAGGNFASASGVTVNCVAKWNGINWSALGSGVSFFIPEVTYVYSLAWDGSNLYAGGFFTLAGGGLAKNIAMWDGSTWSPLGSGISSTVYALAWDGTNLYTGEQKWDGSVWSPTGVGGVYALISDGINLYAGGTFSSAGNVNAYGVAKWDGSAWNGLGTTTGMNDIVSALAWDGTNLYAGGSFTNAGEVTASHIAKWDGSNWSALGSGMNDNVAALIWDGSNLYAGGNFTSAGGTTVNCIAKWDGNNWSALGSGVNNVVYALAWDGSNLYAGGWFTTADSIPALHVAQWDGNNWSALDSGINSVVDALAWDGANLYAGGNFTFASGIRADYIAKWDGGSWSSLGSGVPHIVYELVWDGTYLYAGGSFGIGKWDGSNWNIIGSGLVTALAWDGANLYAGGQFNNGYGTVNYIKKWNGFTWSPLGSDVGGFPASSNNIYTLLWDGTSLYAGGLFTTAGNKNAGYVAGINIDLTEPDPLIFTDLDDVESNTPVTSNTVHIAGFVGSIDLTITGGEYSLNGGAFTSSPGSATNGDAIQLRTTSSPNYVTTTDVIINTGTIANSWHVTTPIDTVPDAFSFTDQNDVTPSTLVTSNAITITGLGASTDISITGFGSQYSINGASYTSFSGFVNNNDTVTIRTFSSANWLTTTEATLTIGGVSDTFTVTTDADTDGDGVGDTRDAFPNNLAASVDANSNGKPDEWNIGCDTDCQKNSGLALDVTTVSNDSGGSLNPWLFGLLTLQALVIRKKIYV